MKLVLSLIVLLPALVLAAEKTAPTPDREIQEFSRYNLETNYLNGLFHGVHDYCQGKVSNVLLAQSLKSWNENNGIYINATSYAIKRFVNKRVEKSDAARVTKALEEQNAATFKDTHDSSTLLTSIKNSKNEEIACSYNLGVLVSKSFYFQNAAPASYQYWIAHLNP
jgi:hypothetical protein